MAEQIKEVEALAPAEGRTLFSEDRMNEARRKLTQNRKRTFEMYDEAGSEDRRESDRRIEDLVGQLKFKRSYDGTSHVPGILVAASQRNKALKAIGEEGLTEQIERQKLWYRPGLADAQGKGGQPQQKEAARGEDPASSKDESEDSKQMQLIVQKPTNQHANESGQILKDQMSSSLVAAINSNENQIALRHKKEISQQWHAPWKLKRVISGHTGWVRCIAVDPMNKFFVTGSSDRTIKFWDLAKGSLKITLTGHVNTVRDLAVSDRHPYLFSCGEDKTVKCWDLEQNKVVRQYHGHLSAVFALALHPELDLLVTGGRDSTARVWDMRTKASVHVLSGHNHTIESILCQADEPQVITGSHDKMIRMWDIRTGQCAKTLTNHKKGVRALVNHSVESTFASAGADKIRIWKQPEGDQLRALEESSVVLNSLALNDDNVLVSGADDGTLKFYDWPSGKCFQTLQSPVQPGSLSSEAAIFDIKFDRSSLRMITAECDKTIKIWKEDETAQPDGLE